jgi:hypothetical protein
MSQWSDQLAALLEHRSAAGPMNALIAEFDRAKIKV